MSGPTVTLSINHKQSATLNMGHFPRQPSLETVMFVAGNSEAAVSQVQQRDQRRD